RRSHVLERVYQNAVLARRSRPPSRYRCRDEYPRAQWSSIRPDVAEPGSENSGPAVLSSAIANTLRSSVRRQNCNGDVAHRRIVQAGLAAALQHGLMWLALTRLYNRPRLECRRVDATDQDIEGNNPP